ncbi:MULTISPECIES: hypothetical protein [Streptosporangium]|uniref:Uncharacterized protein n=1 Tax=Streptosporangium brasiliense TaxID=47480 RepID=A0ABT9RJN1_9ACTN|nr:hypothetical protein [Streptosporangium brasiliense]MDP9869047.1 hypothetical protein [Streptosporangium brasiliense]
MAYYRELHPDVVADDPTEPFEGAHTGLADHRVAKPRGLLARPTWKDLAELAYRDIQAPDQVQAIIEQEQRAYANPRPAEMTKQLAVGLLKWQIDKHITRSGTGVAALTGFRAGPLAEHTDIRHLADSHRTNVGQPLPPLLLRITPAGRQHYATYQRLYDDVAAEEPTWEAAQ